MEYENTLVINFTIKWSFVVHTIIQFLVKSHFHMFSLSYRNLLGRKFLLSLAKSAKLEQETFFSVGETDSNLTDAHENHRCALAQGLWSQSFSNKNLVPCKNKS